MNRSYSGTASTPAIPYRDGWSDRDAAVPAEITVESKGMNILGAY
jgi:hypothetical protein